MEKINCYGGIEFDAVFSNQEITFKKMITDLPFETPDFSELKEQLNKTLNVGVNSVKEEKKFPLSHR